MTAKLELEETKIKQTKENLLDTLEVFSYFIKDESLAYEFLREMREYKCECGKDGSDFILSLYRLFQGTTIKFPSIEELKLYKMFIEHPEYVYFERKTLLKRIALHGINLDYTTNLLKLIDKMKVLLKGVNKNVRRNNKTRKNND